LRTKQKTHDKPCSSRHERTKSLTKRLAPRSSDTSSQPMKAKRVGDAELRRRWRGSPWSVYCREDSSALFLHRVCLPASARWPASVILTRATSIVHPPATTRSAFAVSSPARTSSTICRREDMHQHDRLGAAISADASNSNARRRRDRLGTFSDLHKKCWPPPRHPTSVPQCNPSAR
jgi:hypothetical protein